MSDPAKSQFAVAAEKYIPDAKKYLQGVQQNVQKNLPDMTNGHDDPKLADLARDTVDASKAQRGMTSDWGTQISNPDTWLKVSDGMRGPGPHLLEDSFGREKIHRFDHERIPERVVHARGAGAHGYFKVFDNSASKYTYAPVLTDSSRTTPVFVRFSTVQGSRGSADTVRDVRGFAVKFYTQEGNWDLVGNNIPVFFIQEAMKFPDLVHAVKPEPNNEVPTGQSAHNNFWDYFNLQTETSHMVMWTMSDRGIPRSFRMMQGFGVNTFTLLNKEGERHFVKFHWIPELGVHSFVWDEALKICGQDPDFHRKDLNEAIENGAPPKWTFAIQVIPEKDEHKFEFDILDATKIWPEELVPLIPIGEMVLNKTVDEYFTETEQVAFCTSHVVPGIGFSDDPLLQGRNFSYFDTQLSRLGINWEELPINRPVCPYMNFNRDGQGRHRITKGSVNYWPNRFGEVSPVPVQDGGYKEYPQKVVGVKQRARGPKFNEHFSQAQLFFNSMAEHERQHIINALSFELDHCDDPLVYERAPARLNQIDGMLAKQVALNIGGKIPDTPGRHHSGKKSAPLSQTYYMPKTPTIKSRRIAILVADGFDLPTVEAFKSGLKALGALPFVIGPRRGNVYPEGEEPLKGKGIRADHHFEGMRSTLFDAILIPSGQEHAKALARNGRAIHWVREAFGHLKAIGAIGDAVHFLESAVILPGIRFASSVKTASGINGTAADGFTTIGNGASTHTPAPANGNDSSKGIIPGASSLAAGVPANGAGGSSTSAPETTVQAPGHAHHHHDGGAHVMTSGVHMCVETHTHTVRDPENGITTGIHIAAHAPVNRGHNGGPNGSSGPAQGSANGGTRGLIAATNAPQPPTNGGGNPFAAGAANAGPSGAVSDYGVITARLFDPSSIKDGIKIMKDASDFAGKFVYEVSQHKCYERELAGLAQKVAF